MGDGPRVVLVGEETFESEDRTSHILSVRDDDGDGEDDDESPKAAKANATRRKLPLAVGLCCALFVLIPGIVSIVLYFLGYFEFQNPAIDISSVALTGMNLGYGAGGKGDDAPVVADAIVGLFGGVLGDGASAMLANVTDAILGDVVLPTHVNATVEMTISIDNANKYDISIEQGDEYGTIVIPACVVESNCVDDDATMWRVDDAKDIAIATWEVPNIVLESNSSTYVPISVALAMYLDYVDEYATLLSSGAGGGTLALRIDGRIRGYNRHIPGVGVVVSLSCLATLDGVPNLIDLANSNVDPANMNVNCRQSFSVGA